MIIPSGYITHRDMLDIIGRQLFDTAWTGAREYTARAGLYSREQYERDSKTPGTGHSGSGMGGGVWTPPVAKEDVLSAAYQSEWQARDRYEKATKALQEQLATGQLQAFSLNRDNGLIVGLLPNRWLTRRADLWINKGYHETGELLYREPRAAPMEVNGRARGPRPTKRTEALACARSLGGWPVIRKWTEEATAAQLNVSRTTARAVRSELEREHEQ